MLISAKERKKLLRQKLERDIENKEKHGPKGKSILKLDNQNIVFFDPRKGVKVKKGIYTCYIDIIPWIIKTEKYPDPDFRQGYEAWVLEIGVHRGIGPANNQIVCNRYTYNKKCYICEESKRLYDEDEEKEAKKLWPSWRVLYNVIDKNDEEKGLQLFYTSRKNFHEPLLNELEIIKKRTGNEIFPYELEEGFSIEFRAETKVWNKIEYLQFSHFEFEKREAYSEKILKETLPLDELLIVHTYDEAKNIYLNQNDDEKEEDGLKEEIRNEEKEEKKRKTKKRIENEDHDKKNIIRKLRLEIKNKYPNEHEKLSRNETKEELEEILANLDQKEKLENKDNEKETPTTCPFGYNFGHDCDEFTSCDECDPSIYSKCVAEYDRINKNN